MAAVLTERATRGLLMIALKNRLRWHVPDPTKHAASYASLSKRRAAGGSRLQWISASKGQFVVNKAYPNRVNVELMTPAGLRRGAFGQPENPPRHAHMPSVFIQVVWG